MNMTLMNELIDNTPIMNQIFNNTNPNQNPNILNPNISTLRSLGQQYEQTLSQYEQSLQNYYTNLNTQDSTGSNQVQLFTGENYSGNSISIGVGSFTSLANLGLTNNNIGSAIIPEGFSITLWEGAIKDFTNLCLALPSGNYSSIPNIPISMYNSIQGNNNSSFNSQLGLSFTTASSAVVYNSYPNSSQYEILGVGRYDYALYLMNPTYQPGQPFWLELNNPLNGSIIAVATNPINGNVFIMDGNQNLFFQDSYDDPSPVAVLIGYEPYVGTPFCCVKDYAVSQDSSFFLGVGGDGIGQASIGCVNSAAFVTLNQSVGESLSSITFAPDNTILTIQNDGIYSKSSYMTMGATTWNGPYNNSYIISNTNNGGIICIRVSPDGILYGIGAQDNFIYTKSSYQNTGENWVMIPSSGDMISIAFVNGGNPNSTYQNSSAISMDNSELQNLNAELISLNNQIMQVMSNTYPEYQQQINERSTMNSELLSELNTLIAEKNKVNKTIDYYDSLNQEKNNALTVLTDNYYSYIIYLLLVIILIVIFVLILFKVNVFKDIGDTIGNTVASGLEQLGGKIGRRK